MADNDLDPGETMSADASGDVVPFDGPEAAHAVEVAPRIWWVGDIIEDDPFQSHPYLIEAGRSSVLVDPGSSLTIETTLRKVAEVVPIDDVATILLHHSDPDCADATHRLGEVMTRSDVTILTEWRSELLLRHFAPRFPMRTIEDLEWKLELDDERTLHFALTPYLHFPGAFVSYESSTGTLFSADLFGGFNRARRLVAIGPEDFDDLRSFHEHYMPSREILMSGLATIRSRFDPIRTILPQHGYVIPDPLVDSMFDQLFGLECGVMLMSRSDVHLARLIDAAGAVRRIEVALDSDSSLHDILHHIERELETVLPIDSMAVEATDVDGSIIRFDEAHPGGTVVAERTAADEHAWVVALSEDSEVTDHAAVVFHVVNPADVPSEIVAMLSMITPRARIVVAKTLELRRTAEELETWHHSATHDPLTGLANRRRLDDIAPRPGDTAVLMVDIDLFKQVNDTWGHDVGDVVLRRVADAIVGAVRATDTVVRFGGEEILVLGQLSRPDGDGKGGSVGPAEVGERIRRAVERLAVEDVTPGRPVTVSVGVARLDGARGLDAAIRRADDALYRAKAGGRNRVEEWTADGPDSDGPGPDAQGQ